MSTVTKKALAASFKKLMQTKPMDKITVTDIAQDCGVNRQTFYYHFRDIYDLAEWIYSSEAEKAIGENRTYATWQEGFRQVFDYCLRNKNYVLNSYHSVSREFLEKYLYSRTRKLLSDVVEEKAQKYRVSEEDKAFIANFFKYAFVGEVLDWIEHGMHEDPDRIISDTNAVIEGDIQKALRKFQH